MSAVTTLARPATARPARTWWAAALFWGAGVGLGAVQLLAVVATPAAWRPLAFSSDDVNYYLLPALHAAQGAGSTFNGLTSTNGYQPLWFLVLTGIFRLTGVDRAGAFVVVMVLLVILWAAALWLLWRLRPVLGTVGVAAALAALLLHGRWWSGCENALVTVLLLAAVDVVLRRRVPEASLGDVGVLGGLLAVLVLGRLDMGVLVGLVIVVGAWWWRRLAPVAVLAAPSVLAVGVYAAIQEAEFGVPSPVSGLAKQLGPWGVDLGTVGQFLSYGSLGPLPLCLGATVLAVGGAALVLLGPARRGALPEALATRSAAVRTLIALLIVSQLLQVAAYAVTTLGWELQSWYFSCGVVALVLSAGVVGARLAVRRRFAPVLAAIIAALLVASGANEVAHVLARADSSSPWTRDIAAGRWADRTLPPGAVLAMGDWAGTLAVSTRHPVVQLEGLVGSPDYLDALRNGTVPEYLTRLGVTHYARLLHPGEAPSCRVTEPWFGRVPKAALDLCGRPVVYRGEVSGLGDLVVWDVRPAPPR